MKTFSLILTNYGVAVLAVLLDQLSVGFAVLATAVSQKWRQLALAVPLACLLALLFQSLFVETFADSFSLYEVLRRVVSPSAWVQNPLSVLNVLCAVPLWSVVFFGVFRRLRPTLVSLP
jgi:hypothetical protein